MTPAGRALPLLESSLRAVPARKEGNKRKVFLTAAALLSSVRLPPPRLDPGLLPGRLLS